MDSHWKGVHTDVHALLSSDSDSSADRGRTMCFLTVSRLLKRHVPSLLSVLLRFHVSCPGNMSTVRFSSCSFWDNPDCESHEPSVMECRYLALKQSFSSKKLSEPPAVSRSPVPSFQFLSTVSERPVSKRSVSKCPVSEHPVSESLVSDRIVSKRPVMSELPVSKSQLSECSPVSECLLVYDCSPVSTRPPVSVHPPVHSAPVAKCSVPLLAVMCLSVKPIQCCLDSIFNFCRSSLQ